MFLNEKGIEIYIGTGLPCAIFTKNLISQLAIKKNSIFTENSGK